MCPFRGKGGALAPKGAAPFAPKVLKVLRFDGPSGRGSWWRLAPQFIVSVTFLPPPACQGEGDRVSGGRGWLRSSHSPAPIVILTPGEESRYTPHLRQKVVNPGRREAAVWQSCQRRAIPTCSVVHPRATSWPSPPKRGRKNVTCFPSRPIVILSHRHRQESHYDD